MLTLANHQYKTILTAVLIGLMALPAVAQIDSDYQAPSTMHGKTLIIPRGTVFECRMDESIGSSRSRAGQQFTMSLASPLLANGTDVLIPAGAQVLAEVVEAIPHDHVSHPKGSVKPTGKLRISITGMRTPDGVTYPMVASITGETFMTSANGRQTPNTRINQSVGYVGSQASFEAVLPGQADKKRQSSGGPKVQTRDQVMKDPVLGIDRADQNTNGYAKIRSLVKRGREVSMASGSPVMIKLDAPFKMGITQAAGAEAALRPNVPLESDGSFGRRFAKTGPAEQPQMQQGGAGMAPGAAPGGNPLPGILPDRPGETSSAPPVIQSPGAPQGVTIQQSNTNDF